jgi:lipoyl-dependent peroxiredoxin
MPRIERTTAVVWEGSIARGRGSLSAGSGTFSDLPFSLPSRIGAPEGKTSPEELLAAAHAGCLTMSLAGELSAAGTPPGRLEGRCLVVMDEVESGNHEIVASHVDLAAAVDGIDDDALQKALAAADEGCPFSRLLRRAGADVHVSARLA